MNYADALISYILQLYRFQTTGLGNGWVKVKARQWISPSPLLRTTNYTRHLRLPVP